ncbi:MAG: hypothetical protein R2697_21350 [Ilumatobacteraceae bacterium]
MPDMPEIVAADDVDDADPTVDGVDDVGTPTDTTVDADGALLINPVDSELDGGPDATLPEPATVPAEGLVIAAADERELPPTTTMPAASVPIEPEGRSGSVVGCRGRSCSRHSSPQRSLCSAYSRHGSSRRPSTRSPNSSGSTRTRRRT